MKILPLRALAGALLGLPAVAYASGAAPSHLADLADLSLEQLTRITVTSASRREERLVEAPASVFVLTADDIRRSGATSLPEALRLAPNLHVARADANQYAITARGFNNTLANKLLVLIDGRIVYTPLFSGVFWEAQDVLLEDVDRIEVISGPAGTLWGANAVNGVINIITKPASATPGTLLLARAGGLERGAAVRHGTRLGEASFRAYLKYDERDSARIEGAPADIGDDARFTGGGFRADWERPGTQATLQGDAYRGEIGRGSLREFSGANLTGRLARSLGPASTLELRAYYDRTERRHRNTFEESLDTFDLEFQHSWKAGPAHMLVWGGGHRYSRDDVENSASNAFIPPDRSLRWTNAFIQDEWRLAPALSVIGGLKVERNPYTGSEWLPNVRLSWHPSADSLVWAALSRAVRAPSRLDRELFVPGNPPFLVTASDAFESEVANVAEVGYRAQVSDGVSYSATLFHHDYDKLRSLGLVDGRPVFLNDIEGRLSGVEAWGSARITPAWRVSGGFVLQDIERKVRAGGEDRGGLPSLGNDPRRLALLRSTWSPARAFDVDLVVRHAGRLQRTVPSYTAVDVRLAWRPTEGLEVSLVGQNLLDRGHIEWQNRGVVERSFLLQVVWRS